MASFTHRSYKKEFLDSDRIPFEDIKRNMQELSVINHRLGGHAITLKGVRQLLTHIPLNESIAIVEIGCGGGDNLQVIKKWGEKNGRSLQLTGIDINQECIAFATQQKANVGIHFIASDYKEVQFLQPPHLIFSSLFCHHFTDEELIALLQWQYRNCSIGFFINDLHRHPAAYYAIKILTGAFSKSYLVKNDAPLSVQRGFIKRDWIHLLRKADITHYIIQWKWAFRWLVICKNI